MSIAIMNNENRQIKKMKKSNIIGAYTIGRKFLLLSLYNHKRDRNWYLRIDLQNRQVHKITRSEYSNLSQAAKSRKELGGYVRKAVVCSSRTPGSILLSIRKKGFEECFQITNKISPITPEIADNLAKEDALVDF